MRVYSPIRGLGVMEDVLPCTVLWQKANNTNPGNGTSSAGSTASRASEKDFTVIPPKVFVDGLGFATVVAVRDGKYLLYLENVEDPRLLWVGLLCFDSSSWLSSCLFILVCLFFVGRSVFVVLVVGDDDAVCEGLIICAKLSTQSTYI
jgi:hypothetical protein